MIIGLTAQRTFLLHTEKATSFRGRSDHLTFDSLIESSSLIKPANLSLIGKVFVAGKPTCLNK